MKLISSHKSFDGFTEFYEHDSKSTRSSMRFSVAKPAQKVKIKGGLIWLSGLTCTEENFIVKSGVQRFLNDFGLVVICPDTSPRGLNLPGETESHDFGTGAGMYVDALIEPFSSHYNMYSYVNEEVYNFFDQKFNLNQNISLFGHSMGGHGALTIGLNNPLKYKSISALAPITNPTKALWCRSAFEKYLGEDEIKWQNYDTCELIKSGRVHKHPILIDQGLDDPFLHKSLMVDHFEKAVERSPQRVTVNYRKGYDHSYYFVASFLEDHLKFHCKYL